MEKLILALQFYNSFGDEPILNREELIKNEFVEAYQRETKLHKFTQVTWPGFDNLAEYIS